MRNHDRLKFFVALSMALVAGLLASSAAPLRAQPAPAAAGVGARVVLRSGAALKVGDKVVDPGQVHRVYTVESTRGGWLWLVSGKTAGYARPNDVILLDQAVGVYTEEIKRNPHAPAPYFLRALIHQDQGHSDQALADYSSALQQDANFVPALINRGNIWLSRRNYDRAIIDFTDAIRNDPRSILAHLNRGIAHQAKGELDQALADYDEAIKLGLKTAAAFNNRGHIRELKKDYTAAIADYGQAIAHDPGYTRAWMNRAGAREALGQYDEALADYAEVLRLDPRSPWAHARRAWILATCPDASHRDGKRAVEEATRASDLSEQKEAPILDIRAAAHAEAGDFAGAIFWENRALALAPKGDPQAAEAYRSRLKLYEQKMPYHRTRG